MRPIGFELTISPSTLLLQGKEVRFELEFIGKGLISLTSTTSDKSL